MAYDDSESSAQLPKWKCYKEVYADKIIDIKENIFGLGKEWYLSCTAFINADKVKELTKRGEPAVGDYYVQYEDGYASWSPAKAFEGGYTLIK